MLASDRFIAVDGQNISSTADLLILLADTRPEQTVSVEFSRLQAEDKEAIMMKATVKLQ